MSEEVARIRYDDIFTTDSSDYHILEHAACSIKDVPGGIVEIGTRTGGSARKIIDRLVEMDDAKDRYMFCIDPYGNVELPVTNANLTLHYPDQKFDVMKGDPLSYEHSLNARFDYTNDMRNLVVPALYAYAYAHNINFQFFIMEDSEFFEKFKYGVPVYNQFKGFINKYALVFFDGPHTTEIVNTETNFFLNRCDVNSVFVYDDVWMYDHNLIEEKLFRNGFFCLQKSIYKASYIKKT